MPGCTKDLSHLTLAQGFKLHPEVLPVCHMVPVNTTVCSSQTLQQHYHPEVSRAASVINQVLSVPEVSIAPLLELTAYEVSVVHRAVGYMP